MSPDLGLRFAPDKLLPYDRMGQIDAGECSPPLLRVVTPGGVDQFKSRIDPYFEATDRAVAVCRELPPLEREAWQLFIKEWRAFRPKVTSLFGSTGDWYTACGFSRSLDAWRERLKETCKVPGGEPKGPPDPTALLRWLVIGAGVIGGIFLLVTYAPQIKRLLPGK